MLRLADVRRLAATVEELGGSPPPGVIAALHTLDNLRRAVSPGRNAQGEVDAAIRRAIELGHETPVEEAARIFGEVAKANLTYSQVGRFLTDPLDYQVAGEIRDALAGEAGDQLVLGLSDRVGRAIAGIEKSAGFYSPDATLEQVVELGPEAVLAWQQAKGHGAYLDDVTFRVVRELALMDDLIPPELRRDQGQMVMGAFWVGLDRASEEVLTKVGRTFFEPSTSYSVPAGRWLKIFKTANGLRLNSPRVAIEVLRAIKDVEDQDHFERYSARARSVPAGDVTFYEDDEAEDPGTVGFSEDIN
jgi:hypothetical protein